MGALAGSFRGAVLGRKGNIKEAGQLWVEAFWWGQHKREHGTFATFLTYSTSFQV